MKLCIVILAFFLTRASGIWLLLPASGRKCLSEEIHPNVVVVADYFIFFEGENHTDTTVFVKVTSPHGNKIYEKEHIKSGQFAFTTTEAGDYTACFSIDSANKDASANINLDWKTGIATKDWDSIAKKEKLEGVELQLKKVQDRALHIHESMVYLIRKDALTRAVTEKTNWRVSWLSIISIGACILGSGFQVMHLKTYFRKKNFI